MSLRRREPARAGRPASTVPTDEAHISRSRSSDALVHRWDRRHYGEARRPPVSICGCIRADIHVCEPRFITAVQADAAAVTAEHLAEFGTPGIFDDEMCRAMHRRGHRQLAWDCFSYAYGQAA